MFSGYTGFTVLFSKIFRDTRKLIFYQIMPTFCNIGKTVIFATKFVKSK